MARETYPDARDRGWKDGEEAVVVAAAAAKAGAVGGEGEPGHKNDVNRGGIGDGAFCRIGFKHAEGARMELICR